MPEKDLAVELRRSKPDYVVYAPQREATRERLDTHDNGNEHFLVFPSLSGDMLAVWTQSSYEGAKDHRIVIARSTDQGHTWGPPQKIVGPDAPGAGHMASWGFPIQAKGGRIYVFWNQYHGIDDVIHQFTGTMDCCTSDDDGRTWSTPVTIPMPRSPQDHTDPTVRATGSCGSGPAATPHATGWPASPAGPPKPSDPRRPRTGGARPIPGASGCGSTTLTTAPRPKTST